MNPVGKPKQYVFVCVGFSTRHNKLSYRRQSKITRSVLAVFLRIGSLCVSCSFVSRSRWILNPKLHATNQQLANKEHFLVVVAAIESSLSAPLHAQALTLDFVAK
jgi:hypothetical protein